MHTCTVPVDGWTESGSAARDPTYWFKSFQAKSSLTLWTLNRFWRTGLLKLLFNFLIKRFGISSSLLGSSGDSMTVTGGYFGSFSGRYVFKLLNSAFLRVLPLNNFSCTGSKKQTPLPVSCSSSRRPLKLTERNFKIDFGSEDKASCTESSGSSSFSFWEAWEVCRLVLFCSLLFSFESSLVLD